MADLATLLRAGGLSPDQVPPELLMGAPLRRPVLPFQVPPLPPPPRPETSGIALQPQSQGERDELAQDASSAGQAALMALTAPLGGPMLRAASLVPKAVAAAPRAATGLAGLGAATLGSAEAGPQPNPERDAIQRELINSDPVLQQLERQIQAQESISNAHPREQVKANRDRAGSEAARLRQEFNTRLSDLTKGNLPFDQAHPWLAQNRAVLGIGAPILAGALTRNIGNVMSRVGSAPWRDAVRKAERHVERGTVDTPSFEYHAGRAVNALENHSPTRSGLSAFMRDNGYPAISGGFVGGELAALPHQHNRTNAPPGSKARLEADRALSSENIMGTLFPGVAMGVAGGLTGAHVLPSMSPGTRPVAESQSLAQMLRRGQPTSPATPASPAPTGAPTPLSPAPTSAAEIVSPESRGRLVDNMRAGAPALEQAQPRLQLPAPEAAPSSQTLADFLRSSSANSNITPRRAPGVIQHPNDPPNIWRSTRPGERGRYASKPPKKPPTDETLD